MKKIKTKEYIFKDKKSMLYQDTFNDYGYNIEFSKIDDKNIEIVKYDINKNYYDIKYR